MGKTKLIQKENQIRNSKRNQDNKITYLFEGEIWKFDAPGGWHFVSLPQKLSKEIRNNHPGAEEGWGRLSITAVVGESSWDTAIWFDTKKDTYVLPLKASIRKAEQLTEKSQIAVKVLIRMD